AAGLVATTGLLDPADGRPRAGGGGGGGPALIDLDVAGVESFDPDGDGSEHDEQLNHLVDGDPSTTWRTDTYNSPAFGGLKDGVGIRADLGAEREIEGVALRTPTPGIEFEVRVADGPEGDLDQWRPVATVERAGGRIAARFDEPTRTRHLLIWLTGTLPAASGGYRAEISELTVRGRPA
ncbi:MAG: discoidin domain-containing protein, partial [Actinomycetota bacterium]|nr:discoidin domain-containing protein [Actinomycetota bacterium]